MPLCFGGMTRLTFAGCYAIKRGSEGKSEGEAMILTGNGEIDIDRSRYRARFISDIDIL